MACSAIFAASARICSVRAASCAAFSAAACCAATSSGVDSGTGGVGTAGSDGCSGTVTPGSLPLRERALCAQHQVLKITRTQRHVEAVHRVQAGHAATGPFDLHHMSRLVRRVDDTADGEPLAEAEQVAE